MSNSVDPQEPPDQTPFWPEVWKGVRGTPRDYTSGSLPRAITLLAIPMVLETSMQSVFEVVDTFFVGRLGPEAIAVVGLTGSMLTLVFAVALGLAIATTATVARRIGERNPEGASEAAGQSIILGVLVSLPIAFAGIFYSPELLRLMGSAPEVVEQGSGFCAVILGGNVTVVLLFMINAIFRGAGDAFIAMRVLWLANLINIALDPLFIFGLGPIPAMGVTGAAIATVVGRSVAVLLQLYLLVKGSGRIQIHLSQLRINLPVMGRLLRISLTGMLQFFIGMASWMIMMRVVAVFGSAALAGYTIAVRVIIFALLPSWGMGNAAATLVGQSVGAGKPDRAEKAVWISGLSNMVFLGTVAVLFISLAEPIIRIFSSEPAVIEVGVSCLRWVSSTYVFLAYGMVLTQSFNGAGDTWTPTWINFISYWLLQIPLAWILAVPLGFGVSGCFMAVTVGQAVLALISVIKFRQGKWKLQAV